MRKILWLTLLVAVCGFTSLRADLTVVEHIDSLGQVIDCTRMVKAGRTRIDASIGVSMIIDLESGEMITLMHANKICIKIHIAQADVDAMKKPPVPHKDGGRLILSPTGKKDTISGYATEKYTAAIGSAEEQRDDVLSGLRQAVWLTKATPNDENLLKEMAAAFHLLPTSDVRKTVLWLSKAGYADLVRQMPAAFGPDQFDGAIHLMITEMKPPPGGVPVRALVESGLSHTDCMVLSMTSKPIADSEFAIPADYKQISISP